jgi:hypothetical protein
MPLLFQPVGVGNRAIPGRTVRDWIREALPGATATNVDGALSDSAGQPLR